MTISITSGDELAKLGFTVMVDKEYGDVTITNEKSRILIIDIDNGFDLITVIARVAGVRKIVYLTEDELMDLMIHIANEDEDLNILD